MTRQCYLAILSFAVLMGMANATYLNVVGPVNATLHNNDSVVLGFIGPGESFYVLASASTANASGAFVGIGWDTLQAVSYPQGWKVQSSPLYENPMKLKITTSNYTPNGTYKLVLRAVNVQNYSKLGNITFIAYVTVSQNVFNLTVSPTNISVGTGQPSNLYIRINNTGISDDPFIIAASGIPAWNVTDQVIALHSSASTFTYPVFVNVPGTYKFSLTVGSSTSPLISKSYPITMTARASLANDYSAIGQGVVLSPIIMEPAYSLMLLLSYIYKAIAG